jgi:hypothetical protein
MRNTIFSDTAMAMGSSGATSLAQAEVEFITECVMYSFYQVMRPGEQNDGDWRDKGRSEMAAFAPVIAAMITATVARYTEHERRYREGDKGDGSFAELAELAEIMKNRKSPRRAPRAV